MQKIILPLLTCCIVFMPQTNIMSEGDKQIQENKDYHYRRDLTAEETEVYIQQQKELFDITSRVKKPGFATRTIGFVGRDPDQKDIHINPPFLIKKDSLPGYILDQDLTVDVMAGQAPFSCFEAAVDPEIWPGVDEPRNRGYKGIMVYIMCRDSGDVAASSLFGLFESRYKYPAEKIFRIPEGPGDKCLVGVGRKGDLQMVDRLPPSHWLKGDFTDLCTGDHGMYFVRGNVAVRLQSSIDNFGCMDLAEKLDALFLEEAKRQFEDNSENPESE